MNIILSFANYDKKLRKISFRNQWVSESISSHLGWKLSSFDTHPRWLPVTQSAWSQWSYGKIGDCEQSKVYKRWENLFFRSVKRPRVKWLTGATFGSRENILVLWFILILKTVHLHQLRLCKVLTQICERGTISQKRVNERGNFFVIGYIKG